MPTAEISQGGALLLLAGFASPVCIVVFGVAAVIGPDVYRRWFLAAAAVSGVVGAATLWAVYVYP